jgi:hypothetical protein
MRWSKSLSFPSGHSSRPIPSRDALLNRPVVRGTLRGVVVDKAAYQSRQAVTALAGAKLSFVHEDGETRASAAAGDDGKFWLSLPAGRYHLRVEQRAHRPLLDRAWLRRDPRRRGELHARVDGPGRAMRATELV